MSAAAVVLGLAPTILQMLSPRPCDTALVAVRRPLLALLLSCATPSTTCPPPAQYASIIQSLDSPLPPQARGCFPYTVPRTLGYHGWMAAVVSAVQYAVALGAAANSAYRTYQLCIWTVCTIVPTRIYLPALWHATVVLLHLVGWAALRLSLRRAPRQRPGQRARWIDVLGSELMPGPLTEKLPVQGRDGPAPFFSFMTTALYVGVPVHVSPDDASHRAPSDPQTLSYCQIRFVSVLTWR